ncbi:AsnC family protein [Kitasatospora sp. NPDC097643]|uniref:AsnC family protein n=1 Tax=Kitasatospora sp. NPDC097643 TaxID=3157230 RepID=UPI00332A473D
MSRPPATAASADTTAGSSAAVPAAVSEKPRSSLRYVGPQVSGNAFSELDLALIGALQADPRAPWTRIGPALGVRDRWPHRRADRWSRSD